MISETTGVLPEDPAAFVAAAERATNTQDTAAATAVYAADATLELVTDGAIEHHVGATAIRDAWAAVLGAGARSGFEVRKSIVTCGPDTIVNRWQGTFGGRGAPRGIESWRFGPDGLVVEHRLETFLTSRPSTDPRMRLRLLVTAPRIALGLLRAQRAVRAGARP